MMDKAKTKLFEIIMERIHEDDQIYISGWKACIDYMKEEMLHKCDIDVCHGIQDGNLSNLIFSVMNRFFNFTIESCEDAMFEKMDELIEFAEEQDELKEMEDDNYDFEPPEDDDIYDPDSYLYKEVVKK